MTKRLFLAALAVASLAPCALAPSWAHAQSFEFRAQRGALPGDPGTTVVKDLTPGQSVEIAAERSFNDGRLFRSVARFKADRRGRIDLGRDAPIEGSWTGADRAGAFWSMTDQGRAAPTDWKSGEVRFTARAGETVLATAMTSVRAVLPGVTSTAIPGFPAAMFHVIPDGKPKPVIIILHGAEGGTGASWRFGPTLASLGYAVVGLPYYSADWGQGPKEIPDLPGSFIDIRIDQLEAVRAWLRTQPEADANRIGLFGGSKGAEFALIAASKFDWIRAVVAYAPSDVVWEGWGLEMIEAEGTRSSFSFRGQPLPFMPYKGFVEALLAGPGANLLKVHEDGRAAHPEREAAARIRVEHYRGRLMLVAGDDDRLWASGRMARNIAASRRAAGLDTTLLVFPGVGHDTAGNGFYPTAPDVVRGGSAQSNARAQAQAWPRAVAFLQAALRP